MMQIGVFNDKIEEQLAALKKELLDPYYRKGNVGKLAKFFKENGCVDTLSVDCSEFAFDFILKIDEKDSHSTDYENIVILHSAMKDLPPAVAANPQFWAWEAHRNFADYIHNRSETERSQYTEIDVLRDFFCRTATGGSRRSLVANPLARLWWAGRLLRDDENISDPYHFLQHFTSSAFNSKILLFASSTAANNHEIAMGVMDAIDKYKSDKGLGDITRNEILACTTHLNSIGAVRMIDTLGRKAIGEMCYKVLESES